MTDIDITDPSGLAATARQRRKSLERFDAETSLAIVKKAVELADANPHFIYEVPDNATHCMYTTGKNGKGCLFGQAAEAAGVTREQLYQREAIEISALLAVETPGRIEASDAQEEQDAGTAWGRAVTPLREALEKEGVL